MQERMGSSMDLPVQVPVCLLDRESVLAQHLCINARISLHFISLVLRLCSAQIQNQDQMASPISSDTMYKEVPATAHYLLRIQIHPE